MFNPEGKRYALISHLPTRFTNSKAESLALSTTPGAGRVAVVPVEAYEQRYREYNEREGLSRG